MLKLVGFLPTDVGGEGSDGSNLFFGHRHDVLRQDHKIRKLAGLDRTFDFFFECQIGVVDRFDAQGVGAADLLCRADDFTCCRATRG